MTHSTPEMLIEGPQFLYKYCMAANAEFPSLAELLLTQARLYFPTAGEFNDPFDCKFEMIFKASRLKRERYARELVRQKAPRGMPKHVRKQLAKVGVRQEACRRSAERFGDRIRHRVGILSLSTKSDNILLWSHYA